jgi:twitching motility protein PilT
MSSDIPSPFDSSKPGLKVAVHVPGEPAINQLFRTVMMHKGSDLHLKAGLPGMMRLHGVIEKMNTPILTQDTLEQLIYTIMHEKDKKTLEDTNSAEFVHIIGNDESSFHVNLLEKRGRFALVARMLSIK